MPASASSQPPVSYPNRLALLHEELLIDGQRDLAEQLATALMGSGELAGNGSTGDGYDGDDDDDGADDDDDVCNVASECGDSSSDSEAEVQSSRGGAYHTRAAVGQQPQPGVCCQADTTRGGEGEGIHHQHVPS